MLETLTILIITQFLAMMSPGPDMILILKNTLGAPDRRAGVFTILGIGLGLTIHISLSIGGLALLLLQSDAVYRVVRYAGAAYLAYIGTKSLFTRSSPTLGGPINLVPKKPCEAFREGLLTNLLNPKVTLFILSLFTQVIRPSVPFWEKAGYGLVLVAEAVLVWFLFAVSVNLPVVRQRIARFSLWIDRLFGLILLAIAGSVLLSA